MSWIWGTSLVDEAVDKATSELLPAGTEDIALNLEICDQIRSKSVPAKDAMRALKRRLNSKNPNVQLLALGLTDICIKNGGDHFLAEVASREFMDNLVSILKMPGLNMDVKNKILQSIQNWAVAFESKPSYSYVPQVYKELKTEGFMFPPKDPVLTSSAIIDTKTAPEWVDSEICLRCRDPFSFTNRKHHCRNCGQVYDQKCSSKMLPLPHFGITQEVRVCDSCHAKLTRQRTKSHSVDVKRPAGRHRAAREFDDAELQRAIELSLNEVGTATGHRRPGYVPYQPAASDWHISEPPLVDRATRPSDLKAPADEEDDPDLRAAIEASLAEAHAPRPSAPVVMDTPRPEPASFSYGTGPGYSQSYPPTPALPAVPALPNYDLEPLESDAILTFNQTVEQVQAQNRDDIARYPAVNELYNKANSLRPKLAMSMDDAGRKEQLLEEMHSKLSQAVKLYDSLLTEQVAHPTWRSQPSYNPAAYQQPAATAYSPAYQQWTPGPAYQTQPGPSSPYVSQQHGYAPPQQYASSSYADTQTTALAAPPVSYSATPAPTPMSPVQTPHPAQYAPIAPPTAPVAAPPPPPQQPVLARHDSLSYAPRQHMASPHPPYQAQVQPQQAALPSFPSVPTASPQVFSSYGSGVEQTSRKEALLIEL